MKSNRPFLVVFVAVAITGATASAQETPSTFEFSFSNPGARSLGFGGAVVCDDLEMRAILDRRVAGEADRREEHGY